MQYLTIFIPDKGNTTTYEWTFGESPLSVIEPSFDFNLNDDDDEGQDDTVMTLYSLCLVM